MPCGGGAESEGAEEPERSNPPSPRLPPGVDERVRGLRARIEVDRYDTAAWESLLMELRQRALAPGSLEGVQSALRETYDGLLETFPRSALHWRGYCEFEMVRGTPAAVKVLFGKCLLSCRNVELWRVYLRFILGGNDVGKPQGVAAVRQAYEFTLDHVGEDINAGPVWQEYLRFLKGTEPALLFPGAPGGNAESMRMSAVRRAYKRSVIVPTHCVDALWREFETFESAIDKKLARQLSEEFKPKYQAARSTCRELKIKWDKVRASTLACPPRGLEAEAQQSAAWQALVGAELSNPLRLEAEPLSSRVSLVFSQCLACMYHHPEAWYAYAKWNTDRDQPAKAIEVLQEGCKVMPDCLMLHFGLADLHETAGEVEETKGVLEALLGGAEGTEQNGTAPAEGGGDPGMNQEQGEPERKLALAWVRYLQFVRRTAGKAECRKVFARRAVKMPNCPHQVFTASALMEWHQEQDQKIAKNIFEAGLKRFIGTPDFVLSYAEFLVSLADVKNARALFDRALAVTKPEISGKLWRALVKFEHTFGDLDAALAAEKRREAALDEVRQASGGGPVTWLRSLDTLLLRYEFNDLAPCTDTQYRHIQGTLRSSRSSRKSAGVGLVSAGSIPGLVGPGGAGTQLPEALAKFMRSLPLPVIRPPFPDVEMVMRKILNFGGPPAPGKPPGGGSSSRKRKGSREEPSAGNGGVAGPSTDIYRSRQRQRQAD